MFWKDIPSTIILIICIIGAVYYFDPNQFVFTASCIIFAAWVAVQLFRLSKAKKEIKYWREMYLKDKYQKP